MLFFGKLESRTSVMLCGLASPAREVRHFPFQQEGGLPRGVGIVVKQLT